MFINLQLSGIFMTRWLPAEGRDQQIFPEPESYSMTEETRSTVTLERTDDDGQNLRLLEDCDPQPVLSRSKISRVNILEEEECTQDFITCCVTGFP